MNLVGTGSAICDAVCRSFTPQNVIRLSKSYIGYLHVSLQTADWSDTFPQLRKYTVTVKRSVKIFQLPDLSLLFEVSVPLAATSPNSYLQLQRNQAGTRWSRYDLMQTLLPSKYYCAGTHEIHGTQHAEIWKDFSRQTQLLVEESTVCVGVWGLK